MIVNNLYFFLIIIFINIIIVYKFDYISDKINFFDVPDNRRKIHKKPVSLLGGSIILINLLVTLTYVLIFLDMSLLVKFFYHYSIKSFLIFILIINLLFVLGFLDDKYNISPLKKFILLLLFISIVCINDRLTIINKITFHIIDNELNFTQLSLMFSVGCYVFLIIALNMFDGINLQSAIFYLINLVLIMVYVGESNLIIISLILGLISFSYLNFKNKAFLGDNGVFLLSFLIGYLFVKIFNNSNIFKSTDIALFLFLPVIDCLRVMFERQFIFNKPIFHTDKIHFHHKLLQKYSYTKTIIISSLFIIIPHLIYFSSLNSEYFFLPLIIIYFYLIKNTKSK